MSVLDWFGLGLLLVWHKMHCQQACKPRQGRRPYGRFFYALSCELIVDVCYNCPQTNLSKGNHEQVKDTHWSVSRTHARIHARTHTHTHTQTDTQIHTHARISTHFILYAFCHIFIHTYEIKRNFCEKEICYRITSLGWFSKKCDHFQLLRTVNSHSPKYKLTNDMKFSCVLDRCIKILQMCEKSLD